MCRERRADDSGREGGFTLLEVLLALAVTGAILGAIGSVFAVTMKGIGSADDRIALTEASRQFLADLPHRDKLISGVSTGRSMGFSWRLEVGAKPRPAKDQRVALWVPVATTLSVLSPGGRRLRLETVRLVPVEKRQ